MGGNNLNSLLLAAVFFLIFMIVFYYMKIGGFINILDKNNESWKAKIDLIKSLKIIKTIEIWTEVLDFSNDEILDLKKRLDGYNLVIHGPFSGLSFINRHPEINEATLQIYKKTSELAEKLGAKTITIHAGSHLFSENEEVIINRLISNWAELIKICPQATLENISPKNGVTLSFPTSLKQLRLIKSKITNLKFTIDIGHLFENNTPKNEIENFFKDFGKDIVNIHLHDGRPNEKSHLAIGDGALDLDWFFNLVRSSQSTASLNLEVLSDQDLVKSCKILENII